MDETMKLPEVKNAVYNNTALDLIPVVKLKEDLDNIPEWEHSVRFYFRYQKHLAYIGEQVDEHTPYIRTHDHLKSDGSEDTHRRRLFIYSLIWKSAEAAISPPKAALPGFISDQNYELRSKIRENREHDPKLLWDSICALGASRLPPI
ncbi:hypothetical protein B0T20DRAFT_397900 [Sordaria brevicollis]|uniref:Uncharacterized protein n=1 Tax=Sordaria brevicollis TaxID=83679 RepID=A0AAE0U2A9_SORBR|nr:hypothetical protein B0T20DRAFT_397900 [Sordaria brevicollis]